MKWIQWVLLKIQSGHDSVHRRTDGQTDGQTDKVIPVYPPFNFVKAEGIIILFFVYTRKATHKVLAHLLYRSKSGFVCAQFVSCTGIILGMGSAIERRHYNVMSSLIGYTDIQTDCCSVYWLSIPPQYSDCLVDWRTVYRQDSNISRTKSQNSQDSRTVLRLSLPNPLKPDIKSRMKM